VTLIDIVPVVVATVVGVWALSGLRSSIAANRQAIKDLQEDSRRMNDAIIRAHERMDA